MLPGVQSKSAKKQTVYSCATTVTTKSGHVLAVERIARSVPITFATSLMSVIGAGFEPALIAGTIDCEKICGRKDLPQRHSREEQRVKMAVLVFGDTLLDLVLPGVQASSYRR